MILIHPDDVVIPENRFRREFDDKRLQELRESILRNGLMNPISVEASGDTFTLRAGERRFRVLKTLVEEGVEFAVGGGENTGGLIPAIEWGELTPLQRLEIEVEENVVRADFTWDERVRAIDALHRLRKTQNPEQSIKATATEILGREAVGGAAQPVAEAVLVAKHLHVPEVARAKSVKDALKVIKKITDAGHRAKLAQAALTQQSPHRLIHGDSLAILPTLPAASFDVIVTDPPYGVNADDFGDMAAEGHAYEDSPEYFEKILSVFCDESYRICKDRAHAYIFCDLRRFDRLATLMVLAGWRVFPVPLIWAKSSGMLPFPQHGPRRTYECIAYAWKGDRKTLVVKNDVIQVNSVRNLKHGAQKPVALYCDLLSRSANPGDHILDCFGGTGPIIVAANRMGLRATYIEQHEANFHIAQLRINQKEIDDGAEERDGLEDVVV